MRWSPRDAVASYGRSMVPRSLAQAAPGLATILHYPRAYLRSDVPAGLTVGAVAVPASLAMAELAGVPVVFGLYGTLLPLAVYGLLGSSRQLVIGPDSTLAALTAVTIAPLVVIGGEVDPARYVALTAALALTMGLLLLAAGVLRLGFVADFFGKPVLLGYINGVALIVIASQLGKLFGITVDVDEFFPIIKEVISELGDANGPTVLLSAVLLGAAIAVKRFFPVVPPSLVVLALALAIAAAVDLESHDVAVVGEVEGGLPSFGLPDVGVGDVVDLLLPAAAFALVAFADLTGTVRTFAKKHGYEVDPNRELTAIGGANVVGGLTGAFPVSSSNSRSAVNDAVGAKSQGAVIVAAALVAIFLLFAMPLIEPLPKAALGVIIVVAAAGLINVRSIWRLRHVRPAETGLALVAFGGVLVFGVLGGVAVAIALSIGVFLYRAARPHDAVLGRVEDVDGYHDIERWPGAEVVPGLLVYRFDAPPFFVNAEYLRARVLELVDAAEGLRWLVLNAEAWTYLDATAIDSLRQLHADLEKRGITLCFARLKGRQREIFEETGLTAEIGADRFFPTVRAAVVAFESGAAGEGR
ncbi:MAG TPA: sulfate permease [Gaiellaceae bacterium]|nr:sulfate permease [Gaiellaceae bacterium]